MLKKQKSSYRYFVSIEREKIIFSSFAGNIEMQATETKKQLNLHEPEAALAGIDALKARCRAEKKADVPAAGTTPADLQVTDQFLFRCGVESLMKVKSLVAPTKVEKWLSMKLKRYWKITCSREKDLLLPNKQNSWLLPRGMENLREIFWHV